jgi:hypothetical protein
MGSKMSSLDSMNEQKYTLLESSTSGGERQPRRSQYREHRAEKGRSLLRPYEHDAAAERLD